jgi:hypothetical protein
MRENPKPIVWKSKEYKDFISAKPCVVCGRKSNFHHEGLGNKGMGSKVPDSQGVPLCPECHTIGSQALHRIGPKRFWKLHNIDVKMVIIKNLTEWLSR